MAITIRMTEERLEEIDLNPTDEEQEITQNVTALAVTPIGSVPLERGMGIRMSYIDLPMNIAPARFEQELTDAVETWEPRTVVTGVEGEYDYANGRMVPEVTLEVNDEYEYDG